MSGPDKRPGGAVPHEPAPGLLERCALSLDGFQELAAAVFGADGRPLAGAGCLHALGWSAGELASRTWPDLVHPDEREAAAAALERLQDGRDETARGSARFVCRDGSYLPMAWSAVAFPEASSVLMVARKLEDLDVRERIKGEFLSIVSHELRTPLTSVLGSLALLSQGVGGELPAPARPMVAMATRNAQRLVSLVNQILDADRIASGSIELLLQPTALMPVVEQAITAARGLADERAVEVRIVEQLPAALVRADRERLHQALASVVLNGVKFSPQGGVVELAVERVASGRLRLLVSDRGPGIPPDAPDVFARFSQLDPSDTRVQGGVGLGLSVAKAIVERHGGSIGHAHRAAGGTTFHIELDEWHEGEAADAPIARKRVLIYHRRRDIAALLRTLLEEAGLEADVAHELEGLAERLKQHSYAAVTVQVDTAEEGQRLRALVAAARAEGAPPAIITADVAEPGPEAQAQAGREAPLEPRRWVETIKRLARRGGSRKPRVLHVEDDPDVSRLSALLLRELAEVSSARSLSEARRRLETEAIDLVILDQSLPDGHGLELSPLLKRLGIPIVVFSVSEVQRRSMEGIAAALVKTQATGEELRRTVRALLADAEGSEPEPRKE